VNRGDIVKDFETRGLLPPVELIRGDCLSLEVRDQARAAVGGTGFDVIVTDPPYGVREAFATSDDEEDDSTPPLTKLFYAMGQDRSNNTPLLKPGGRLVAFVPVRDGETLEECLPDVEAREEAGLVMEGEGKEQVLNDILSRWLVSFVSVES
jgi:tRNA G10  N-methylase Trm11